MRPVNLKISAFGPYSDLVEIPFDKLGTSGLYLISGDTGSGKTSIFDAISFAIFGQASGDDRQAAMLRSRYADPKTPTFVELVFIDGNKKYIVRRSPAYDRPKLSGKGYTKQASSADLTFENGQVISGYDAVSKKIENILGINRDQFSRISMIAQGDFRKLLFSDTNQTGEIYRKLFNTDIYLLFEEKLKDRIRNIKSDMDRKLEKIHFYLDAMTFDSNDPEYSFYSSMDSGNVLIDDFLNKLDKTIAYELDEKEKYSDKFDRLASELDSLQKDIIAAKNRQENINEKKSLDEQIKNNQAEIDRLKDEFLELEKTRPKLDILSKKINILENSLGQYEDLERSCQRLTEKEEEREKFQIEIRDFEDRVKSKENNLINDRELISHKISLLENKNSLTDSIEELKETVENLNELYEEIGPMNKERALLSSALTSYKNADKEFSNQSTELLRLRRIFNASRAGLMAKDLIDGLPCPVCGSKDHPQKAPLPHDFVSESDLHAQEDICDKSRDEISKISSEIIKLRANIQSSEIAFYKKYKKALPDSQLINIISEADFSENRENMEDLSNEIKKFKGEKLNHLNSLENERDLNSHKLEKINSAESGLADKEAEIQSIKDRLTICKEKLAANQSTIEEVGNQILLHKEQLSYPSLEEAEKALKNSRDELETLQEKLKKAETDLNNKVHENAKLQALSDKLSSTIEAIEFEDLKTLEDRHEVLTEEKSEYQNKLNRLALLLDNHNKTKTGIEEEYSKLKSLEKDWAQIANLSDTCSGKLRGKERISFESFVQMAYLDRILFKANRHLMAMSSAQYELKRKDDPENLRSKTGLDLSVIDHYNGTERSVKSLSGGESFLAALSLALGLSEEVTMSSGGIKPDCLFIDEGFGSLDDESLVKALNALANLGLSNKLIAIISHVPMLKESIDKQILVTKTPTRGSDVQLIL